MKVYSKLFLTVIFLMVTAMAQGATQSTLQTNKAIIVTSKSPVFILTLPSNRTTGYGWFLTRYDHTLVEPISHQYVAPKKVMPGKGGEEVWTFKAKPAAFVVPHLITIMMTYTQPWDLAQGQVKTFAVITQTG